MIVLVVILGLGGCAGAPILTESCPGPIVRTAVTNEPTDASGCAERATVHERAAALGAVRQRGTQTRTVGVPREFFVAMIVIIVLVALI